MKYYELDEEEMARYQAYARTALDKTKNVNLRVSEADLMKIKTKA